jgi:predicted  nucleic acid-binding Zn-ribbon protein
MSRNSKNPSQMSSNLEDEINVRDYPYYRFIPIESISFKQKQMLSRMVPQNTMIVPYEQVIIPAAVQPIIQTPQFVDMPTNKVEQETNYWDKVDYTQYQEDISKLQSELASLRDEVQRNYNIIDEQQETIHSGEMRIQEQNEQLNSSSKKIEDNNSLIHQQIAAYNHNITVLQGQCAQSATNHNEILKQQQTLYNLQYQISQYQSHLQQIQYETEQCQQQLAYHGSMITAFNTLIQNPQYFAQLMSMAATCNFEEQPVNNEDQTV